MILINSIVNSDHHFLIGFFKPPTLSYQTVALTYIIPNGLAIASQKSMMAKTRQGKLDITVHIITCSKLSNVAWIEDPCNKSKLLIHIHSLVRNGQEKPNQNR